MKRYKWNARKCAVNLTLLAFRIAVVVAIVLVAGFNPYHII